MQSPLDRQTKRTRGFLDEMEKKNRESFEDALKNICRSGRLSPEIKTLEPISWWLQTHDTPYEAGDPE